MKHIQIESGLSAHLLQTRKFKTNVIVVLLRTEITRENATKNALLAGILGMGCKAFPTELEIARKCEEMYGAEIDVSVVKKGEEQIIQLYMEVLNGDFETASYSLFEGAGELLSSLLFKPVTENAVFKSKFVDLQKERLRQVITGRKNDKKNYAKERCIEIMCEAEPFGIYGDGYEEDLDGLNAQNMYEHYQTLLRESPIEVGVIGDISIDYCRCWVSHYFKRGSEKIRFPAPAAVLMPGKLKEVTENIGINQGKLVIAARCDFKTKGKEFCKLILFNEIMGGGASSKLFKLIREKHSLCYYINSSIFKAKSIIIIQAGISNYEKVRDLIFEAFEDAKRGSIETDEVEASKNAIINQLEILADSQHELMDFYMSNILFGDFTELEELKGIFQSLSIDDLRGCSEKVRFDTCYFLK